MATTHLPPAGSSAFERAARLGFRLSTRETDTGQTVWEWSRGDEGPYVQFVSERVARQWMLDWIQRFEEDRGRHAW